MELPALEKHAVKDNADVSRILKTARGEIDDNGDFVVGQAGANNESSDPVSVDMLWKPSGTVATKRPDGDSAKRSRSDSPSDKKAINADV